MKASIVAAMLFASVAAARADDAMSKAANDFYVVVHASSGLPDAGTRARLQPLITPALDRLLARAATAEGTFMQSNKGSPPLVEGDLFSSLFEGPTSFVIGACSGSATAAQCAVNLTYDDKSKVPTHWTDTVFLANTAEGWKVDDIGYGGNWDFGNKGRLSDTLKQVVSFSSE